MGEKAMAGDFSQGAVGEGIAAAVGSVLGPNTGWWLYLLVGDVLVMVLKEAAGAGSDIVDPAQRQAYLKTTTGGNCCTRQT